MESGKSEGSSSGMDLTKWGLAVVLVIVAIAGNAYFSDQPFLYRLVGVVFLIGGAGFVAATTAKGAQLVAVIKDARAEARRVVWPTKQETWTTSGIVVVVVLISALILWGVDYLLGTSVSYIIG